MSSQKQRVQAASYAALKALEEKMSDPRYLPTRSELVAELTAQRKVNADLAARIDSLNARVHDICSWMNKKPGKKYARSVVCAPIDAGSYALAKVAWLGDGKIKD